MSDIQAAYQTLTEVHRLLSEIEVKLEKLTGSDTNTIGSGGGGGAVGGLRRELRLLTMYTVAIERWSGSDTLAGAMNYVQQMQQLTLRLYMLIMAVNALAAGPTPFGLLYAGANILGLGITLSTLGQ